MNSEINYLKAMGILQWRLRGVKAAFYCYAFYAEAQEQPVSYLLADVGDASAEQALVLAIAKAVQKKFVGECVQALNFSDLLQTRVLILLGERVKKVVTTVMGSHPMVVSYSPAELLANPRLKAKTWEAIKKAIQLMA